MATKNRILKVACFRIVSAFLIHLWIDNENTLDFQIKIQKSYRGFPNDSDAIHMQIWSFILSIQLGHCGYQNELAPLFNICLRCGLITDPQLRVCPRAVAGSIIVVS